MLILPPTIIILLRQAITVQVDERFIRKLFTVPISPPVALICL
jgi:hypothetical protein